MKYDVAIVGSGLGGLLCGYILSKNGMKVAIFEKHHQPGGCLQTFKRSGTSFDTGMHYIGGIEEGQELHLLLKYFDLFNHIKLQKLDEDGFDHFLLKGKEYRYAMGFDRFVEVLAEDFPSERAALQKYVDAIQDVARHSFVNTMGKIGPTKMFPPEFITTSVGKFLESVTDNKLLQNVLAANNPLYAGRLDKTSMYVHSLVTNTYIGSAYRIIDGSDTITNALINSIKSFGGEIFLSSEVTRFEVGEKKMDALIVNGEERIEADHFISGIHPQATLDRVDETPLLRKVFRTRIRSLKNTISNFTIYLKFKKDCFRYKNFNLYYYRNEDVWDAFSYTEGEWPKSFLMMNQARSKDTSGYAHSAIVIAYMNFEDVARWNETTVGKRGQEYLDFKKAKAEKLLQELELCCPGINDCIETYYTSSPLTYRDYTGTTNGSMYGVMRDCSMSSQLMVTQKTKIPNLFFTGQNINAHGMLGVAVGSIITCSELIGAEKLIGQLKSYS